MELVILIGLQGAGKSSFARQRFPNHKVISKDLMRSSQKRKAERQARLLREALDAQQSVVVDSTNVTRENRKCLIEEARVRGVRVAGYYFGSGLNASFERNRKRTGDDRVPDVAIFAAVKLLEEPDYREGFDELYEVRMTEDYRFRVWRKGGT